MTYILFNRLANGGKGEEGIDAVQAAYAAQNPETLDITSLDTAAFFAKLTAEDQVILCGGDGTIHRLVNDLGGQCPAVPVYIWKFGTGNDFLRDAALLEGRTEIPQKMLLNDYMPWLAAAEAEGQLRYYLNGCSLGVDAVVCAMMEENRHKPRKSGYAATALRSFFQKYKPIHGRVTVDGETREYKDIWMAASMNGHFQGGGMKFAPEQDRRGDTLCCMVWHGTTALGTLLRFPTVIPGKHVKFKDVCDIRFGREITVELDEPTVMQLDGEVIRGVSRYTAHK